jgi:hypothetical protein
MTIKEYFVSEGRRLIRSIEEIDVKNEEGYHKLHGEILNYHDELSEAFGVKDDFFNEKNTDFGVDLNEALLIKRDDDESPMWREFLEDFRRVYLDNINDWEINKGYERENHQH